MRISRRVRLAALAVALVAAPVLSPLVRAQAQEMVIVYVDVDRIISDVGEGKAAQAQLAKEQQSRQSQIQAAEAKIKKLQEQLDKAAKAKQSVDKIAAEYQQALGEYQGMLQRFNKELADKERELFDPVEKRVKETLRAMAARDGWDMILNKRNVPFGRKDLDYTDKVTQEYDKAHPVAKSAPTPAPAASSAAPKPPVAPPPAPPASAPAPAPKKS